VLLLLLLLLLLRAAALFAPDTCVIRASNKLLTYLKRDSMHIAAGNSNCSLSTTAITKVRLFNETLPSHLLCSASSTLPIMLK
jgi:hypothetical protein